MYIYIYIYIIYIIYIYIYIKYFDFISSGNIRASQWTCISLHSFHTFSGGNNWQIAPVWVLTCQVALGLQLPGRLRSCVPIWLRPWACWKKSSAGEDLRFQSECLEVWRASLFVWPPFGSLNLKSWLTILLMDTSRSKKWYWKEWTLPEAASSGQAQLQHSPERLSKNHAEKPESATHTFFGILDITCSKNS